MVINPKVLCFPYFVVGLVCPACTSSHCPKFAILFEKGSYITLHRLMTPASEGLNMEFDFVLKSTTPCHA